MLATHLLSRALWMRHRLATQLVALIVLVALMSGGAVGLLVVDRARLTLRDEILRSSLAEADLAASLTRAYMTDTESDARDLAESSAVRAAATNQDLLATSPVLERWLSQHPNLVGVSLADATGIIRATGLSDKTNVDFLQVAERDWFRGALSSGRPFLGAARESSLTHRPLVPYSVPVLDENGSLRAMLVGSISLEALSNSLTLIQVGPNARLSLIDVAQHVILAHPDPSRILTQTSGRNPGKNEATRQLEAGQRGALENINTSGDKTLAAFTPVPGLAWGVLIQQPSTKAFAPVDDMLQQVIILIGVGLVLAGGVGVGLAVGIIRPVRQLRTVLDAMANGELGQRVRSTRQDELGELGHGFDRMADQLQQTLSDLQEGEARFRGIIAAAFDGYAIHQHGRILEASEAFATLFGYGHDELVGESVLNLAAPESRALVTEHITSEAEAPYECVGVKRDEKRFYMELVDNACLFEGRPARAIAVRDVTPRRQAEEQRSRMAAIVDASSEAIVGFARDATVTGWNRGAEHIFGYSADDMIGRSIARLVPPDGLADYIETRQRLMRGEGIQGLETVRVRQDGTRIEVSLSISVVRDGLGQVVGAAMVAHDITERKRAEAALQESETRYRRLVELSPQAIMVHDGGTILYANVAAARLAGVPDPADLLGSSLWDLIQPDDRETLRLGLAALPRTPDLDSLFEARLVQRTGEVLDTEISTIPTTYGGQPAYQAIVNDITPRKTAEKQAHTWLRPKSCARWARWHRVSPTI